MATIAQESGVIPCIIGDLNASNYPTEAGSTGTHGPLSTLSAGWGMSSTLDDIVDNYHTYWMNEDGVSRLDHFIITSLIRPLVKWAGVDYSSDFAPYGLHRPIAIEIEVNPQVEGEDNQFEPPVVVDLNLSKDEERYLYEHTIAKGNSSTKEVLDQYMETWRSAPTAVEADRILVKAQEAMYQGVAEDVRNTHQRFKNKPHGWSPTQMILHAQLAAIAEIRRRIYVLGGRKQWRHKEVQRGVWHVTKYWREQRRKYRTQDQDLTQIVGLSPEEMCEKLPGFFSWSWLGDQIDTLSTHLHYEIRKQKRMQISEAVRRRELRFQAGKN